MIDAKNNNTLYGFDEVYRAIADDVNTDIVFNSILEHKLQYKELLNYSTQGGNLLLSMLHHGKHEFLSNLLPIVDFSKKLGGGVCFFFQMMIRKDVYPDEIGVFMVIDYVLNNKLPLYFLGLDVNADKLNNSNLLDILCRNDDECTIKLLKNIECEFKHELMYGCLKKMIDRNILHEQYLNSIKYGLNDINSAKNNLMKILYVIDKNWVRDNNIVANFTIAVYEELLAKSEKEQLSYSDVNNLLPKNKIKGI